MPDRRFSNYLEIFERAQQQHKCMHPDASPSSCLSGIVQAHSVSVASLKAIANEGHILGIKKHPVAWNNDDGTPLPRPIGLTQASTFTGFCSRHDDQLFAPIEKRLFRPCNEHAFLLLYRAAAKELFAKSTQAEALTNFAPQGLNRIELGHQNSTMTIEVDDLYAQVGQRECADYKNNLDEIFRQKDWGRTKYLAMTLGALPEIMCSGLTTPTFDFHGRPVQNYADLATPLRSVSLTLFQSAGNGLAVFAWLEDDNDFVVNLLESLLDRGTSKAITNGIVRFVFGNFENFYLGPRWWNTLSSTKQADLIRLFHITADTFDHREADFWTIGCGEPVDWPIVRFDSNCTFYNQGVK